MEYWYKFFYVSINIQKLNWNGKMANSKAWTIFPFARDYSLPYQK